MPTYANLPRNGLVLEYLGDGNALDTNDGTKATLVTYAITDSFHSGKPVQVQY